MKRFQSMIEALDPSAGDASRNELLHASLRRLYARYTGAGAPDTVPGQAERIIEEFARDEQGDDPCFLNMLRNSLEIFEGKETLQSRPLKLSVSLTRACNLECIMCPDERGAWEIPEKTAREIREFLPYLRNVQWQGGEVFLSDRFEELFDEAAGYEHLRQTIVTNGLLLDERWIGKLVDGKVTLELSIDGVTRPTYEKIRRGARFDALNRTLALVRDRRERSGRPAGFVLKMHFVVMRSNAAEIEKTLDFAAAGGFDELLFDKVIDFHDEALFGREDIGRDPAIVGYLERVMPRIRGRARDRGIAVHDFLPRKAISGAPGAARPGVHPDGKAALPVPCGNPWRKMTVDPGGDIKPNCACVRPIGHVASHSLGEAWNGEHMRMYRRKLFRGEQESFCNRMCLAEMVAKENDIFW